MYLQPTTILLHAMWPRQAKNFKPQLEVRLITEYKPVNKNVQPELWAWCSNLFLSSILVAVKPDLLTRIKDTH